MGDRLDFRVVPMRAPGVVEGGEKDVLRMRRQAVADRSRAEAAANSLARSATLASSLLFGTISSTRRHCTARLPLMPSSMVQK